MIFSLQDQQALDDLNVFLQSRRGGQETGDAKSTAFKIGITSGTWDLLHYLHLVFLIKCRRKCDFLIVGVDSDFLVADTKGPSRPIVPEHQRVAMVDALKCVGAVYVMDSTADFLRAVVELPIDVIFKNEQFEEDDIIGRDQVDSVVIIPDVRTPDSTSAIVEECIERRGSEQHSDNDGDQACTRYSVAIYEKQKTAILKDERSSPEKSKR